MTPEKIDKDSQRIKEGKMSETITISEAKEKSLTGADYTRQWKMAGPGYSYAALHKSPDNWGETYVGDADEWTEEIPRLESQAAGTCYHDWWIDRDSCFSHWDSPIPSELSWAEYRLELLSEVLSNRVKLVDDQGQSHPNELANLAYRRAK
jgi:hypothetical protein